MFVFDEVDFMDTRLIDALKPFVEYRHNKDNINYGKLVFIFLR